MSKLQHRLGQGLTALALATVMAIGGFAQAAWATPTVTGTDYYGNGAIESGTVDVLSVGGEAQETIYLKVQAGSKIIADRLSYTLTDNSKGGSTEAGASRGGVISLSFDTFDAAGTTTYTVTAYSDRAETQALYTGVIYAVYAQLGDTQVLIGTHTVAADSTEDPSANYTASSKLFYNDTNYALDSNAQVQVEGSKLIYQYNAYTESESITGSITYVDTNGTVLKTTEVPGVTSEGKTVSIPSAISITEDGTTTYWRTVFFQNSVTLSTKGQSAFTITCKKINGSAANPKSYTAIIKMVAEDGTVIAQDSANVTGKYYYTLPSVIYKNVSGTMYVYELQGSQVLSFDAENDNVTTGSKEVTATYTAKPVEEAGMDVVFKYIDGTKKPSDSARSLGQSDKIHLDSTNTTAVPEEKLEVGGTTYKLAGTQAKYSYTLGSTSSPVVNVYYLPEGYTPSDQSYTVTVNYVNFLTKETIKSSTFTSKESDNNDYQFVSEASFKQGSEEYVRLAGQDQPISHSFYSGIESYTVYYRNVKDTYISGVVINTIRVVYTDGGTEDLGTDGSATTRDQAAAADAAAGAGTTGTGRLNADGTYSVADGDGSNSTLTNEAGVDSNTERINDDETPLASGADNGRAISSWAIGSGVAVAVGLMAGLFMIFKRRRKETDEEQSA